MAARWPRWRCLLLCSASSLAVAAAKQVCVEMVMQVEDEMWKVVLPSLLVLRFALSRPPLCLFWRPASCSGRENLPDTINTKFAHTRNYREAWMLNGTHWQCM